MIGSLTSGVQAMSSFVKGIEVIGNNISNINTVGFKGATTRFQDTFSNTLQRGTGNTGLGSNSITQQIGTGSKIATIKTGFAQGSLQTTGGLSDLGISGEGFFRVRDTLQGLEYVTRAGDFRVDDQGYLVTNSGFRVQGLGLTADNIDADSNGVPDGEFTVDYDLDYANLRDIRIDYRNSDPTAPRMETFQIDQGGNVNIFLSDGTSMVRGKVLLQRFQDTGALVKEGDNLFSGIADAGPTEAWPASRAPGALSAQIDPTIAAGPTGAAGSITAVDPLTRTITTTVPLTPDTLTGGVITLTGAGAGTYRITANTANTLTLQAFEADPADWATTGAPDATSAFTISYAPSAYRSLAAAQNGNGRIISGSIEMSNVDLTNEFANMITTQRAFQAASKLITTSDEILQDIVNLKR